MGRVDAFANIQRSQALFSENVIGMSLYSYQKRWADYVVQMAMEKRNETVIVEMSRQSGKNETSAHIEANLLASHGRRGGSMVKCAPTWKPQIVNSKLRFDARSKRVTEKLPFLTMKPSQGYMYVCHEAVIQFLSAAPTASVVGATASILLEVDESQDVDKAKYDKDFSPMRASTGAPVVHYGTTWTDDTLLEREKRAVQEGRAKGRIYRVLPDEIAAENPAYGEYVDGEVARLGRDHPLIKTQYFLEPLPGSGRMFKEMQLRMVLGDHVKQERRTNQKQIVAGLDFAGADENADDLASLTSSSRDSVALSVGEVQWTKVGAGVIEPIVRLLARYEWVNLNPVSLNSILYQLLWDRWKVDRVHCDATGIGATGTAFLAEAINKPNRERVQGVTFDSAWNAQTELAFQYMAAVISGRLQDYKVDFDPLAVAGQETPDQEDPDRHAWWQRGHAKLEARPNKRVRAYVPEDEGHDDMLISEMLMVDAAHQAGQPKSATTGSVDFYG